MWVFDGEQWTEEGAGEVKRNVETITVPMEQFVPELQVVEVVPVVVPKTQIPFPLP
jgi:hypothetical protein